VQQKLLLFTFSEHIQRAWPSFFLLAPPIETDTAPLYGLTRDWCIPIPQISAGVFTYQINKICIKTDQNKRILNELNYNTLVNIRACIPATTYKFYIPTKIIYLAETQRRHSHTPAPYSCPQSGARFLEAAGIAQLTTAVSSSTFYHSINKPAPRSHHTPNPKQYADTMQKLDYGLILHVR
jgi:hypothetical protein